MSAFSRKISAFHPYRVVVLFGVIVLFTQYVWKTLYIGRVLPAPYWLFVYMDQWFLQCVQFSMVLVAVFFAAWILSQLVFRSLSAELMKIALAFVFLGVAFVLTFPIVMAHNTVTVDRLRVGNSVYYLSAYPMFVDVIYAVAKCEPTGQICVNHFTSREVTGTDWTRSRLLYDATTKKLNLLETDENIIYTEVVK